MPRKKKSIKITLAISQGKVSTTPKHKISHSMSPVINEYKSSVSAIIQVGFNCQVI